MDFKSINIFPTLSKNHSYPTQKITYSKYCMDSRCNIQIIIVYSNDGYDVWKYNVIILITSKIGKTGKCEKTQKSRFWG